MVSSAFLLWILTASPPAVVDTASPSVADGGVAHAVSALAAARDWSAGTIEEQLTRDTTLVPFGKGAIFVPAMTNPLDEPPVSVWQGGDKIGEGTTGKRLVLLPGTYIVRIGSGAEEQRFQVQASVRELFTTIVPATWSGLAVHVVDEQLSSVRQSYEIIRVEDRQYFGVGFGSNEQAGEPVTTWILQPGLYKIVRIGESYRARTNFSTVRVMPGQLTHFLLVVDADTGDFKGGGEVPATEVFQAHGGVFWTTFVLGGDMSLNTRRNVPGSPNVRAGEAYAGHAFADGNLSAPILGNPFLLRLQIEEGQSKAQGLPLQKSQDQMVLDALYVYRLAPWIGPYLRGSGETNLLTGYQSFKTPTDVEVDNEDGTLRRTAKVTSLRLSKPFGFTSIKEGAGLNLRLFKAVFGETSLRLGVGARHRITDALLESTGSATADPLVYRRVASTNQVGIEATIIAVARITRWALLNLELDSLTPFDEPRNVVLEAAGSLALKVTAFISVNYVARFLRDPTLLSSNAEITRQTISDIFKQARWEQDVLLRFSFEIP